MALDAGSFVDDVEEFSTVTINSAEDGTSEMKENDRLGWNAIDCCGNPVADKVDDLSFLNGAMDVFLDALSAVHVAGTTHVIATGFSY